MSSNTTEKVHVKVASLHLGPSTGDWVKDTITLKLATDEKLEVEFDLDPIAVSLLGLTIGPVIQGMKQRAEAQGDVE